VYTGYYVEDARILERGWWPLRKCNATILNLVGHRGVTEAHVLEIPPGGSIPQFRMALEEVVYVMEGTGITSVWAEGFPKITFEWGKHSLFRIPANYYYEMSNARGDQPALTLHTSYLPLAMTTNSSRPFFFDNPYVDTTELYDETGGFYSAEAKAVTVNGRNQWHGNFFPDLTLWDKLTVYGGGGRLALQGGIVFPGSSHRPGLMVLPSRRYRNAHRHGPGVTIIGIQEATGFVIMWPQGKEKKEGEEHVIVPWQEGSVFVPPNMWYHMHVNSGSVENRQLRIFPPRPIMNYSMEDPRQYIPLTEEEPWIRKYFEAELAKNGLTSLMPEEAYTNPDYVWADDWLMQE
jgi:oxalate decarboxylase/phosphoglucose isomerase-like protein (cupin superfamily)